jgi:beta-lactamase regulating signal transducer with metallopeptidase domain
MNRIVFAFAVLFGALMPLVFDSALKGTALLVIATLCTLLLHRASAATRHLVWFAAIVALLVVPVLSSMLPQWRVLPGWAVVRPLPAASGEVRDQKLPADAARGPGAVDLAPLTGSLPDNAPPSPEGSVPPVISAPSIAPDPSRTWHEWLVPVWGMGFTLLALRLLAAHLLLRCAMRGGSIVRSTPGKAEEDRLLAQLVAACGQLGIRQRVTLLLDERRTIPVVWGVFRPRLLLPAESQEWSDDQVRSVLLHELAHIQRRDTLAQWLTQIACALHWWNPLVWLAAWRLHVERERACDDLVLASGVRASTYAEHLLHVATKLSPARWTAACGLAMARSSSLEGRLLAVLSQKLNRRGTTRALAATTLAIGTLIAIPLAMLRAADERNAPQAKLVTGPIRGSTDRADAPTPQRKEARVLYEDWQRLERSNGDIPGALVGELAAAIRQFIQYNPTWETVPQLNAILPRLDAARDWKAVDAIALLDEVAAVQDSPLDMPLWRVKTIRQGEKLPQKFAGLDWRGPVNGPRVAWLLEPGSAEHRLGVALKARLLVWNPGPAPAVLQVPTFHQGGVTASDAQGVAVQVSGITWTTLRRSIPVRLGPGDYVEINTPGVGLGQAAGREPWAGPRVGFQVLAKAGDELTLAHSPVPLDGSGGGIRDGVPPVVGAGWWLAHIQARLSRELPLPSAAVEREHLLRRVVNELFGDPPTAEETAVFTADQTSGALDALARRLAGRRGGGEFAGTLAPAPIRFRVVAADPGAAEVPRVVLGPGEYPIGAGATLKIVGRPDGDRYIYDTRILFEPTEATGKLPPEPHMLEIPGDRTTWAIVCRPGSGHLYVLHKGAVRKIDYTNPGGVTETPATDLPAGFRDEVKRQLDLRGVTAESQSEVFERPAPPAASPARNEAEAGPRADAQTVKARGKMAKLTPDGLLGAWRGTVNQEKLMLSFHRPPAQQGVQCDIYFGEATIGAPARFAIAEDGGSAEVIQLSAGGGMRFGTLLPIEPGKLKLELYGRQKGQQEVILVRDPEGAATEPRQAEPRKLFKMWQAAANEEGTIPGVFIGALAAEVQAYVKANPTRSSAMDLSKLLPRLVTSHQWTQAEAIQLLDDVAYYAPDTVFARAGTAAKASEAKLGSGKIPEAPSVDSLNPSSVQ